MLNKFIVLYLSSAFFKQIALTIPHAFLFVMLSTYKDINIVQYTLMQISFFVAVLLFEIPSGKLSDYINRRFLYITSIIILIFFYLLVVLTDAYIYLLIGWFIYGVATAISSGTYDVEVINKIRKEEGSVQEYKKLEKRTTLIASLIGANIGLFAYQIFGIDVYFLGILLLVISLTIALILPKTLVQKSHRKEISKIPLSFFIVAICSTQLFIQLLFHYWQIIFIDTGFDVKYFSIIYSSFMLCSIVATLLISKCEAYLNKINILMLLIVIVTMLTNSKFIFLIGFLFAVILIWLIIYILEIKFYQNAVLHNISYTSSIISMWSRVVGLLTLIEAFLLLQKITINQIFIINTILMVILLVINNIVEKSYISIKTK